METAIGPNGRSIEPRRQWTTMIAISMAMIVAIFVSVCPGTAISQVFQFDAEMHAGHQSNHQATNQATNQSNHQATNQATNQARDVSEFRFHGRRFNRQGGPPIILAHGILNSYGVTEKLARFFEKQGFDVWIYNQPGFGQEGKVTKAIDGGSGNYGLAALVNGVDKMVEHVTKATGQKPVFGGFSLGGIALELYLQGVTGFDAEGNAQIDQRKSIARQKKLARAVFLGTPVLSFEHMTRGLKLMYGAAYCVGCVIGDRSGFLDIGLGKKDSLVAKAAGLSTTLTPSPLLSFYLQDVTNYENLDPDSRKTDKYLSTRFSNIHMDLVRDLVRTSRKSDSMTTSALTHVDAIYVVGTKDGLANHAQIRTVFERRRSLNPNHQMISVEGAGHLDLMENKMIDAKFGQILSERLRSPMDQQWFLMCKDSFRAI